MWLEGRLFQGKSENIADGMARPLMRIKSTSKMFCINLFKFVVALAVALAATVVVGTSTQAADITSTDIVAIPANAVGSGNGTLDLRLMTYSGSEIPNAAGSFNGDNGNNTLPQGGGADVNLFDESYVTTGAKLKAYYDLNFPPSGSIQELVIFLDLNETGGGEPTNTLGKLDIVLNPTTIQGSPDPIGGDVSSATQAAIDQVYSGGLTIANLNPQPADNLPVNNQGAGFADYAIFTHINPYSLNDSDVVLFNISMSQLNDGAEEIFLSGTYAGTDIVPEPSSVALAMAGIAMLGLFARRRR